MVRVFRQRFVAFVFCAGLLIGFGLKLGISTQKKFSVIVKTFEGDQPTEEEKSDKDEKSSRIFKMIFLDFLSQHSPSLVAPSAISAQGLVYLVTTIVEPLITVPVEPPEPLT